MGKPHDIRAGDMVRVIAIPPDLDDRARIDTPQMFQSALGKTFRVEGISEHGHLELVVAERTPSADTYESDTIWIEAEFVEKVSENSIQTI
ncbi:MAG TPA: hypothetical protein VE867_06850 [Candidatus Binatia bacterium]|nr:hypothetical protein [Candidatus Binatia bacterium]